MLPQLPQMMRPEKQLSAQDGGMAAFHTVLGNFTLGKPRAMAPGHILTQISTFFLAERVGYEPKLILQCGYS